MYFMQNEQYAVIITANNIPTLHVKIGTLEYSYSLPVVPMNIAEPWIEMASKFGLKYYEQQGYCFFFKGKEETFKTDNLSVYMSNTIWNAGKLRKITSNHTRIPTADMLRDSWSIFDDFVKSIKDGDNFILNDIRPSEALLCSKEDLSRYLEQLKPPLCDLEGIDQNILLFLRIQRAIKLETKFKKHCNEDGVSCVFENITLLDIEILEQLGYKQLATLQYKKDTLTILLVNTNSIKSGQVLNLTLSEKEALTVIGKNSKNVIQHRSDLDVSLITFTICDNAA